MQHNVKCSKCGGSTHFVERIGRSLWFRCNDRGCLWDEYPTVDDFVAAQHNTGNTNSGYL